ncbi:MAG: preprotein translocase subunit SecG [Clostridiales bacterium]|nr:preprotein translocase subunit SecG [Candidatus Coliplasma caballi]
MSLVQYIVGAVVIVLAVVLVVLITFQQGKRKGLENVISGNSSNNSFLNKTEAAKKGKKFEKMTLYVAIAFAVIVIAMYLVTAIGDNIKAHQNTSSAEASTSQAE